MSFGPNPWQQTHWDARAAGNFIGGGAGSGLIVATFASGAGGNLRTALIVLAMTLIGCGLLCVWAEIGRPWRAINVIFNPRTSWMSREAVLAPLLLGGAALMVAGVEAAAPVAALAAVAFLYCQARILQAARGIAAWREPLTVPLIVVGGLAEGAGLYAAIAAAWDGASSTACVALAVLLVLRAGLALAWQRRLTRQLRAAALRALQRCGVVSHAAGLLPLAIVLAVLVLPLAPAWAQALQMLAGALAVAGGAAFKFVLITRAAFNQGFALPHLPVRGVRR
jgi:phenylacetyl-CoA:acceptor oxidoreductase subunit 2